ncbi:MAG: 16S rRNA (uracil(1498)-N(3))-methyltransferase [candidate division Zixibacteria bacterium]|nr:16S rRNA (uracil(1498)-N(3))-methyltransferase [candidate division Zixibacteria bacterium]
MMSVFYVLPDRVGTEAILIDGQEAHHLQKVMRMKKGEPIMVVDGIGNAFRCEIEKLEKKVVTAKILTRSRNFGEPLTRVTLAAGLSVGYKFDDVIQRATELGVARFVPLITEKSKVKIEDEKKAKAKVNRWNKVAVASIKQCGRAYLPAIETPVTLTRFLETHEDLGRVLLFDPNSGGVAVQQLELTRENGGLTVLIGPESGFSRAEVDLACVRGAQIVSLGGRILRTENAAPTALAVIMYTLGEFS